MPLFSLFCPHLGLSRCSHSPERQGTEARNGSPFCPCCQVLRLPREESQDRGKPSTTQQNEEHNRTSRPDGARVLPMPLADQERNKGRGKEERKKGGTKERRRQAHKPTKRGYPTLRQVKTSCFPHHKFAPKNQQKVALGCFEKIFGKIFRGNVSGERKTPCVISTEGGIV